MKPVEKNNVQLDVRPREINTQKFSGTLEEINFRHGRRRSLARTSAGRVVMRQCRTDEKSPRLKSGAHDRT
jgi:DNA-binding IclR family transcriptional regulator